MGTDYDDADWLQALLVRVLSGLTNANLGIVSAMVGELSDASNQSAIFSLFPVFLGFGVVAGNVVGGVLAFSAERSPGSWLGEFEFLKRYPYNFVWDYLW
jgi:MFS family permease